ncbi:MAG: HAD family hydrolase [Proteobacteria bacterium]|nr:HAD family hydrolase [Pseudomonadota bacterium]
MKPTIKAVILDIDDTLYLERDYVKSGFTAVGQAIGLPEFGAYCWQLFQEGIRGNTFDLARSKFELSHHTSELVRLYREHRPNIQLCPDARAFIESASQRLAVVSDGPLHSQRAKYQALGLVPWIECPIFTQEIGAPKPSQCAFQLAAWTLQVPYEACVYIADNPNKDFAGPKALGMHTIRMRRAGGLHEAVPSGCDIDEEWTRFEV